MWRFRGHKRPAFAEEPGPGQESVWDYPRPPSLRPDSRRVEVRTGEVLLARSAGAVRVCETASPPTFYLPPGDVATDRLAPANDRSFCEWKGVAMYWTLADGSAPRPVAWSYPEPTATFRSLAGHLCFYPGRVDCFVDGERVRAQQGEFYGGWITPEITGPFKGDPGTGGW